MLAILERILSAVSSLLGLLPLLELLGFDLDKAAHEHTEYLIENTVVATSLNVADPTHGLAALHSDILAAQGAILAALDGLTVELPTEYPPTWPLAPGSGDVASAVWNYYDPSYGETAWMQLVRLELMGDRLTHTLAVPLQGDPLLVYETHWKAIPD
jgi:hypothetical protein